MEGGENRGRITGRSCWGIVIGAVIILFIVLAAVWFLTPFGKPVPIVKLIQPDQNLSIQSGDVVVLIAQADSRNGVESIDFLVDGKVSQVQSSEDPSVRTVEKAFSWSSSKPGVHKLSVIAHNTTGKSSSPAEILVVVNPNPIAFRNTTNDQTDTSDDAEGDEVEARPGQGVDSVDGWHEGVDQQGVDAFLEEIDIQQDEAFPIENPIFGGDTIPEIISLELTVNQMGNQAEVIYSVVAEDDRGLISISLAVANMDDPFSPVDEVFETCGGELHCTAAGSYTITQGGWYFTARAVDISGQSSIVMSRQVHILEGGDPPAIAEDLEGDQLVLDPNMDFSEIEHIDSPLDDLGEPWLKEYGCEGQIVYLAIPYTYQSDHGDEVYVGAMAEKGNILVAAGHESIVHGTGTAYVKMEAIAEDLADQTDELYVYLRSGEDYFYEETVQLDIFWPTPQPDLTITNVIQAEAIVSVDVKNQGCTAADGYDIQYVAADGSSFIEHVDYYLAQGITHRNEVFINPNLFSLGFVVKVDPQNAYAEINEENNTYSLEPITIKYIEFYKIFFYSISEGFGRGDYGEFKFFVELYDDGFRDFAFPRDYSNSYYSMNKGAHPLTTTASDGSIQPFRVTPVLSPGNGLKVSFFVFESDSPGGGIDDLGDTTVFLSPDFFDDVCWKEGGEFQVDSNTGYYTVYWRIILNER